MFDGYVMDKYNNQDQMPLTISFIRFLDTKKKMAHFADIIELNIYDSDSFHSKKKRIM